MVVHFNVHALYYRHGTVALASRVSDLAGTAVRAAVQYYASLYGNTSMGRRRLLLAHDDLCCDDDERGSAGGMGGASARTSCGTSYRLAGVPPGSKARTVTVRGKGDIHLLGASPGIAVGTALTGGPPHRSVREELIRLLPWVMTVRTLPSPRAVDVRP